MKSQRLLPLNFSLALMTFCLVYYLNFASPRFYPLEGIWRWENVSGAPSMGWYARFGWSLLACIITAFAGRAVLPAFFNKAPDTLAHKVTAAAWLSAFALYAVAVASVILHEIHALQ